MRVQEYLGALEVPFKLNPRLVRGLDYYTKTAFEVVHTGLGSQDAICGGGRYDGLVEQCGGRPTPAVGAAAGLERLLLSREHLGLGVPESPGDRVFVATLGDAARPAASEFSPNSAQPAFAQTPTSAPAA